MTRGSTSEIPRGIAMVVIGGGATQNKKAKKNEKKKGKEKSGLWGQKLQPKCFLCGNDHNV